MEKYDIYHDIAKRTDGDVYVGAVGPVRTGKSTFIRRFTELFLVPNIAGKNKKKIATDELPQSGDGKTITTTEPKFIPGEAVKISLRDKTTARMRLIDCVGYLVDGAIGHEENGAPRLVKTPWSDKPVSFAEAAETGTEKVISEHSTIGVVVTTDGSFTDIPRADYEPAERKAIEQLKKIGKPFTVVLNSREPGSAECRAIAEGISKEYDVPVVAMNVLLDGEEKFAEVMESALNQFPLRGIDVDLPDWLKALPPESEKITEILSCVRGAAAKMTVMRDAAALEDALAGVEKIIPGKMVLDAGEGVAKIDLSCERSLFYEALSEACGEDIKGDYELIAYVTEVAGKKAEFDGVSAAVAEARESGYGIVVPSDAQMTVGEPELVRRGAGYGVKITAEAESLHLVKVGVKAAISPLSGTKKQCEDFMEYIKLQTETDGAAAANIFGRQLGQLVSEEMNLKVVAMPDETRAKVGKCVAKMVNDGKYRLFYFVY